MAQNSALSRSSTPPRTCLAVGGKAVTGAGDDPASLPLRHVGRGCRSVGRSGPGDFPGGDIHPGSEGGCLPRDIIGAIARRPSFTSRQFCSELYAIEGKLSSFAG